MHFWSFLLSTWHLTIWRNLVSSTYLLGYPEDFAVHFLLQVTNEEPAQWVPGGPQCWLSASWKMNIKSLCLLSFNQQQIHKRTFPSILQKLDFFNDLWCGTLAKAFWKFKCITSAGSSLCHQNSEFRIHSSEMMSQILSSLPPCCISQV